MKMGKMLDEWATQALSSYLGMNKNLLNRLKMAAILNIQRMVFFEWLTIFYNHFDQAIQISLSTEKNQSKTLH